jgi:cyanophycinase-like exopeptidase
MNLKVAAFLIAGLVVPIALHIVAGDATMPWWPDTVSMGIAFGFVAVVVVSRMRADRERNRRLWRALRECGVAIGRRFGSN